MIDVADAGGNTEAVRCRIFLQPLDEITAWLYRRIRLHRDDCSLTIRPVAIALIHILQSPFERFDLHFELFVFHFLFFLKMFFVTIYTIFIFLDGFLNSYYAYDYAYYYVYDYAYYYA